MALNVLFCAYVLRPLDLDRPLTDFAYKYYHGVVYAKSVSFPVNIWQISPLLDLRVLILLERDETVNKGMLPV